MGYRIALIPGDGIGKEVIPETVTILDHLAGRYGFEMDYTEFDYSCERYMKIGNFLPENGIEELKRFEAIFLGAVGDPQVPDHVSLWELLIPIRR
jgi:tartrate dehydrogenase/decarboxylase/D-malate dehydrogenase